MELTVNPVSTCSFNISTPIDLLPSVITSVVHDHAAPVAQYLGALDTSLRRSRMRLSVWRCFRGRARSFSRIRSMTPVKSSS